MHLYRLVSQVLDGTSKVGSLPPDPHHTGGDALHEVGAGQRARGVGGGVVVKLGQVLARPPGGPAWGRGATNKTRPITWVLGNCNKISIITIDLTIFTPPPPKALLRFFEKLLFEESYKWCRRAKNCNFQSCKRR